MSVYIFENTEAERVKVGTTGCNRYEVSRRLETINEMWEQTRCTCPICGAKVRLTFKDLIGQHYVSGISCQGAGNPPLERDISVAEEYLKELEDNHSQLVGAEKCSNTKRIKTLKKRIEQFRDYKQPVGEFKCRVIFKGVGEPVEKGAHEILGEYLDKKAPFGEVFSCSVETATEAVEEAISMLGVEVTKEFYDTPVSSSNLIRMHYNQPLIGEE